MIKIGRILFEYCKVCISFKENCKFQVSLKAFGFTDETIKCLSDCYIRYSDDSKKMKLDPRISNRIKRDGDEFINIFEDLD